MSDWIKSNKYTVLFIVLIFTTGFFSIIKPYVDKSDKRVYDIVKQDIVDMREEVSEAMDTLIKLESSQLEELEKLNK